MKKILSLLGTITLIGTSTTSLVACNNTPQEYTKEELEHLKKENQINTANQEIKNNLEGIAPQEKPFNNVDNKYYFVVGHGKENDDGKIIKFKYDKYEKNKVLDKYNNYELQLFQTGKAGQGYGKDICLVDKNGMPSYYAGSFYPNYFKSVYRGKLDKNIHNLVVDKKTGEIKVEGE